MSKYIEVELNSNLFNIVRPDTYQSFDPEFYCGDENMDDEEMENYWNKFDSTKYRDELCNTWVDVFSRMIPKSYKIKVTGYYSPQYYNYTTDSVGFTVKIKKSEFNRLVKSCAGNSGFWKFMKTYGSCEGFISLMPDCKAEFDECLKGDVSEVVAECIDWAYFQNIGVAGLFEETLCNEFMERYSPEDFSKEAA